MISLYRAVRDFYLFSKQGGPTETRTKRSVSGPISAAGERVSFRFGVCRRRRRRRDRGRRHDEVGDSELKLPR